MPRLVAVVCGPTASGKTALAVRLALALNGEVVSADSMQVYRQLNIGTAKPSKDEMCGVPHHMLDVADPAEDYSVARYVCDAVPIVDDILARGKLPIIAGGTGLYLDALIAGRAFAPFAPNSGLREELEHRAQIEGLPALFRELRLYDPDAAGRIHPNDAKRIIRALEVFRSTGKTISQHNRETNALPPRYNAVKVGLRFQNRADLWAVIDARVDDMFDRGLPDEVRALSAVLPHDCTAMQAIGYKELSAALALGQSLDHARAEIKLHTRQYAKRQLTWFRRDPTIAWFLWGPVPKISDALRFSTDFLTQHGIG